MLRVILSNPFVSSLGVCPGGLPALAMGQLPNEFYSDIADATINYSKGEGDTGDRFITKSFAENIVFYKDAANYLKVLLLGCNPNFDNSIEVEIFDDCCNETIFKGKIFKKDVQFCEIIDGSLNECEIKVSIDDKSDLTKRFDCLRNTLVMQRDSLIYGTRFDEIKHPFIRYCKESRPKFFSDVFVVFFILITNILTIFYLPFILIIGIISFLLSIACPTCDFDGNKEGNQSLYDTFSDALSNNSIARFFTGCGKGHLAPLIRDMIFNVCAQCNMGFESSVLNNPNSPYYNLAYLEANSELSGTEYYDNGNIIPEARDEWYRLNALNANGINLLNKLANIFNCFWDVLPDGGGGFKIVFEPRPLTQSVWVDLSLTENNDRIKELCFKGKKESGIGILELEYSDDFADIIGNESGLRFNDLIDWKDPIYGGQNNASLIKLDEHTFPFAKQRYQNDGINRCVVSFWVRGSIPNWAVYLPPVYLAFAAFKAIASINPFASGEKDWQNYLTLSTGATGLPKLIILEGEPAFDFNYAKAIKIGAGAGNWGTDTFYYNFPMWFADSQDLNNRGKPFVGIGLFDFWEINNPSLSTQQLGLNFELTLQHDCKFDDTFQNIFETVGFNFKIKLPYLGGFVESQTITGITFNNTEIKISGTI